MIRRSRIAERVFALLCHVLLPRSFRRQFGEELLATFRDRCRSQTRRERTARWRFWRGEILGLLRAGLDQYGDAITQWRQRLRHHPSGSPPTRDRTMIASLLQDLKFGIRMIAKTPVVSTIAVVSLAIGVAANTTVFSLLHSWLLRPLPYPDAERLVILFENNLTVADNTAPVAPANYFDWIEQSTSFETSIASRFDRANLTGNDRPEEVTISVVTPNFFQMLGTDPLLGRSFVSQDGVAGSESVTVIGELLWRNRFGADPRVIGTTVTLDGESYTIVGVIPERFDFVLGSVNLWLPSDFHEIRDDRETRTLTVTAKLREGVAVSRAQSELTAVAARLQEAHPETNTDWSVNVQTFRETFPGPMDRGLINILMLVVGLVLLVACANIASLLMAKTEARQKELTLRLALGAGRLRVVRQLLTESVVMALIGGALGMTLSVWGIRVMGNAIPDEMPGFLLPSLTLPVFLFGVAVSVLAGLTFGITPASQAIKGDFRASLVEGGRGGTATRAKKQLRRTFVVVEFAIALAVLVGAVMLMDLFHHRLDVDLGFRPDNVLTMAVTLPEHRYGDHERTRVFAAELERKLEEIGGTTGTALASVLPRTRSIFRSKFTIDGRLTEPNQEPTASWLSVSVDYFTTMGIAVRRGRGFSTSDRADAAPVIVVNQRLVDLHFPESNPIGRRISIEGHSREIVGIADNIAQRRLTGLMPVEPSVYFPMAQVPVRQMRIIARAAADPYRLAVPLQNAVWSIDANQPVSAIATLTDHMEAALAGPTILARLVAVVGALALSLASIGIYGVMAFAVATEKAEIGIRMALGAKPMNIVGRVTRQGAALAGFGLAIGIPLAVGCIGLIATILGRGAAADGLGANHLVSVRPILSIGAILVAVCMLASYLPALGATKIHPASALQQD